MITRYFLKQIKYNEGERCAIFLKLKSLSATTYRKKIRHSYIRNDIICDYEAIVDCFDFDNAIEVLEKYIKTCKKKEAKERWGNVVETLKKYAKNY